MTVCEHKFITLSLCFQKFTNNNTGFKIHRYIALLSAQLLHEEKSLIELTRR